MMYWMEKVRTSLFLLNQQPLLRWLGMDRISLESSIRATSSKKASVNTCQLWQMKNKKILKKNKILLTKPITKGNGPLIYATGKENKNTSIKLMLSLSRPLSTNLKSNWKLNTMELGLQIYLMELVHWSAIFLKQLLKKLPRPIKKVSQTFQPMKAHSLMVNDTAREFLNLPVEVSTRANSKMITSAVMECSNLLTHLLLTKETLKKENSMDKDL